ncbi:phosphoribosylanthranilate isomerase [Patescibacteria group bacterium]|nr:phosphoribosylanthranilate isomerase [Patescibacteria group bacterium]
MKPKVKICGVTNLADAEVASKAGADYLGFIINYPQSPRNIASEKASEIVAAIKENNQEIKFVGVLVDQPKDEAKKISQECQLDILQLHGQEAPEYCRELRGDSEIWKAVICANESCIEEIAKYQGMVDKILLDSGRGSGQSINLELLKQLDDIDILAGGIGLDNIEEVLEKLNPQVIDINSQIEKEPGKKDIDKMVKIIRLIKS